MIYLMYTILEEIFVGVSGSPLSVKLNQVSANDLSNVNFSEYSSCAPKLQGTNYKLIHFCDLYTVRRSYLNNYSI